MICANIFARKMLKESATPPPSSENHHSHNNLTLILFKRIVIKINNIETYLFIHACQIKYLNNIVDQNHRLIKQIVQMMLNFKAFYSVKNVLTGFVMKHMITMFR